MDCLVAIVGPTGIGKSQLALRLAQEFHGEIINADSRQIYRHMDIGTAKPASEERAVVPHHLIDIIDPDEKFSLAQYQELAFKSIAAIQSRGRLPLLVGGSGLYIWAVVEGWEIPKVAPDPEFRRRLERKAADEGVITLYNELRTLDPAAAQKIDPRNIRRVIRALEVTRTAQTPFSSLQGKKVPPFQTLIVGLTTDRAELYRRIDRRVEGMIERGFVDEVRNLITMGYSAHLPAMSGIGYRQIASCIEGGTTLDTAVHQIQVETHRFVRRQYNWFRLNDARISWFDVRDIEMEVKVSTKVAEFVGQYT